MAIVVKPKAAKPAADINDGTYEASVTNITQFVNTYDRVANRGLRASVYAGAKVIRDKARAQAPKAAESLGSKQPPPGTLKRSVIMTHVRELSGGGRQTFYVLVRHGKKYSNQGKRGKASRMTRPRGLETITRDCGRLQKGQGFMLLSL